MYSVYRRTDPPTAIDHALYCHFTTSDDDEKELVTVSSSYLRVYRLNTSSKSASSKFLECILETSLYGNVTSIASGRLPKCSSSSSTDCLLLAFDEAKLSVVRYDPDEHCIKVVSLHCFEDDILRGGVTKRNAVGAALSLRADPADRCAAMLVYGSYLAILPFQPTDGGLFGDEPPPMTATAGIPESPTKSSGAAGPGAEPSAAYLRSYTVALDLIDPKLQNVVDFCFLHGYHEPTILFLYEPIQTTSGRLAIRQDTFCILAVSLNIKDRIHAVIWTLANLPFDCFRVTPVPKPIGGVVVFAVNSTIYLNQSVPPFGVVLNANGRDSSAFPLRSMEDRRIQLDGSHADFLSPDTMMLALRSGDLYTMTLLTDNMNAVKGFYFDRACAGVVIPSVVRKCAEGYAFLGSRLGDSRLMKYAEKNSFAVKVSSEILPAAPTGSGAAKKARLAEETAAPEGQQMVGGRMEDDLELYGEVVAVGTVESARVGQYRVDECDTILNLGPIRQCVFGEPVDLSDEFNPGTGGGVGVGGSTTNTKKDPPIVDLVASAGHAKDGCLVVLQRSVRPTVITTNPIPGAQRLWAVGVYGGGGERNEQQEQEKEAEQEQMAMAGAHQHLILSKEVMTMVLELKTEISELESSGFLMNQRTVAAGNLCGGRYVVQVAPMAVALMEGSRKVQNLALDLDFPITQASIADPYVVLLTENGELLLLTLIPDAGYEYYELVISQPEIYQNVPATAISAYKDASGMFQLVTDEDDRDEESMMMGNHHHHRFGGVDSKSDAIKTSNQQNLLSRIDDFASSAGAPGNVDDEDALLYGDEYNKSSGAGGSGILKPEPIFNRRDPGYDDILFEGGGGQGRGRRPGAGGPRRGRSTTRHPGSVMPTYWLAVARENGLLEIFRLPDFHLVYMVKKFPVGYKCLFDTDPIKLALEQEKLVEEKFEPVQELLLIGLGGGELARPHLLAVVEEELLIYEAFPYFGPERVQEHLSLRFKRLFNHGVRLRNGKGVGKGHHYHGSGGGRGRSADMVEASGRLYPFENIGGYAGVFVAGPYPYWLIMTGRGSLRCHPMQLDGRVIGFTPFHNVNCQRGFIYLNEKREMRICQLPGGGIDYDCTYPARKIPLRATPYHLVYHADSRTYALALGDRDQEQQKTMVTMAGDEKQFERLDKEDENFVYPSLEKFKIQLYSASETTDWEPIIPDEELIQFEEFERVTVLKDVQLKSEGTRSGMQSFLAIGTIGNYGEEVSVRGRLLIAEVVDVVPDPDRPSARNKLKVLYNQEQKGPVTSLCSVQGYLLTGMGPKVYIWSFKDNDLQGISFLDLQIYIHRMISIRNMALIGDVYKSVCLLRYQEGSKALSLASRDPRHLEVYAMEFMIDNRFLGFVVSDQDGNVYVYTYQPEAKESLGGQRLVRRADINVGARINAFARRRARAADPIVEKKMEAAGKHVTLFGTLDGAVGYFLPLAEKIYRRLLMLQNILHTAVPHEAGLNPRAYRAVKQQGKILFNPQKNILDGDLLATYFDLNLHEKLDVAKRIGTTKEQLMDDLLEIERMATHV